MRRARFFTRLLLIGLVLSLGGCIESEVDPVDPPEVEALSRLATRFVYALSGADGVVAGFWLDAERGKLAYHGFTPTLATPSSIAQGRGQIVVADLASGTLRSHPVDSASGLLEHSAVDFATSASSGIDAVLAHPTRPALYAAAAGASASLISLRFDDSGISDVGTPERPLPSGGARQLLLDPSGRFLYARGDAAVSIFRLDAVGQVANELASSPLAIGGDSRGFVFAPSGLFAYSVSSLTANVEVYAASALTGELSALPGLSLQAASARALGIDPRGRFLFVATSFAIDSFRLDRESGALTRVSGSPFATRFTSGAIAADARGNIVQTSGQDVALLRYAADGSVSEVATRLSFPGLRGAALLQGDALAAQPGNAYLKARRYDVPFPTMSHIASYAIGAANGGLSENAASPIAVGIGIGTGSSTGGLTLAPGAAIYGYNETMAADVVGFRVRSDAGVEGLAGEGTTGTTIPLNAISLRSVEAEPSGRFLYLHSDQAVLESHAIAADGSLGFVASEVGLDSETSMTVHPSGRYLYLSGTLTSGPSMGMVTTTAHGIDPLTGVPSAGALPSLDAMGMIPATALCDEALVAPVIGADGRHLFALERASAPGAGDGELCSFVIASFDGHLLTEVDFDPTFPSPARRFGGLGDELLAIAASPVDPYLYLAIEEGGVGGVRVFEMQPRSAFLTELSGSPFAAPLNARAMGVDDTGRFLYVSTVDLNFFDASNDRVTIYRIASDGSLTQSSLLDLDGGPFFDVVSGDTISRSARDEAPFDFEFVPQL